MQLKVELRAPVLQVFYFSSHHVKQQLRNFEYFELFPKWILKCSGLSPFTAKIKNPLTLWRKRLLTLQGRILVFKTLAFSRLICTSYISDFYLV